MSALTPYVPTYPNTCQPVVVRYPKDLVPPEEFVRAASEKPFELGKSVQVRRGRKSVLAIASYGTLLPEALKAAEALSSEKIAVEVINARFAAPVDEKFAQLLSRGKALITIEDHLLACGFGSAVLESVATAGQSTAGIRVLGAPRRLVGQDSRHAQLMQVGVTADEIVKTAKEMLAERTGKRKRK